MKYSNIVFYTLLPLLVITSVMTGYTYRKTVEQQQIESLVETNSRLIQLIAVAGATQSKNSDVLIEILNILDGREHKDVSRDFDIPEITEDDVYDLTLTFEQLRKDQEEVKLGIGSLTTGNMFQGETLFNIYDKLKESIH